MSHQAASTNPHEVDGGWIHVKSKPRRRDPKSQHTKAPSNLSVNHSNGPLKPRTDNLRGSDDIAVEYNRIRARWEDEAACRELKRRVQEGNISPVSRAVCLGIGTFDPPDGGWEAKRRTFVQLIAFLVLVECLEAVNKLKIECIFQEPIFTSSDRAFIESLGHHVVESPRGFEMIHSRTLLFGVHLYRPIYVRALENSLPAIFVGTDLDIWDWVTIGQASDLASTKNVKVMEGTYTKLPFPQDSSTTAFTSTAWYWRRRDVGLAVESYSRRADPAADSRGY